MNQRIKRAQQRRAQDLSASTIHTGGHIASHSRGVDPVVRTPQKATGDVAADRGFAQASPYFKTLEENEPQTKAEEKRVIAEATETTSEIEEELGDAELEAATQEEEEESE